MAIDQDARIAFNMQAKLQTNIDCDVGYTVKDDPIISSIVDTVYPEDWI
ncbi:10561_t:CDS:1, partial [Funneliformis geosporum]